MKAKKLLLAQLALSSLFAIGGIVTAARSASAQEDGGGGGRCSSLDNYTCDCTYKNCRWDSEGHVLCDVVCSYRRDEYPV
jgi:hypothetical protein